MSAELDPSANRPSGPSGTVELALLGPFEAHRDGGTIDLGGARPRALLGLLALQPGAVASVDRIVDDLWGEKPPRSARHMVAVYVSRLRTAVGEGVLVTRRPGYLLDVDPALIDAARFERLVQAGRDTLADDRPELASLHLGEALGLWRGPALADFAYEPFAQAEIRRLEELRLEAEEAWIEARLALGQGPELVSDVERLVQAEPLRELRRSQQMRVLYRSGRQADALAAYQEARRAFVDELGIDPGPGLRELERAILAQDDQLLVAELDSPTPERESRRTVTLVVAEPAGGRGDSDDPEVDRLRSEGVLGPVREVVERFGGSAELLPDGSLLAVFGLPVAHEDDCLRAARATDELRKLRLVERAGLATGEVVVRAGEPLQGTVLRAATGLNDAAEPDEVLLGETAGLLVRDVVELELVRGRESRAFRLIDTGGDARAWPPRVDVSLVGRRQELTLLRAELHRAIAEGRARLVTVVGEPGIGKSRLARELRHAVRDEARVLVGRCPAYGEALTYWPLREIVSEALEEGGRSRLLSILGDEAAAPALADRVESLLTEASAYPVEELRWAAQRFLSRLASHVPVVVMIDDVHWVEPTFVDLVDFAVRESDAPLLVLCLARPEFLEEHPDWAGTTVALESLSEEESFELLGLLAPAFVEDERIVAAASGNPLFLEQLAAFAAEQRGVEPAGAIPPSLRSLLAARLDRLGPGERAALECAAVVGHDFPAGAVAELLPPEGRATVERHLRALTDRGLVEDHRVQGLPEHGYRFRHVLIQEAAYRSLPKSRRAELHERLATWLERELTRPTEDEIIGYHLEKAHGYTRELGGDPGETRALAARAGARLATAGEAALARNDLPAGTKLLAVATELLEVAGEPRLDLLADLGTALFPLGELREALAVLERAVEAADAAGEPGVEWRARLELDYVSSQMKADTASNAEQLERAEEAIRILTQVGDERGLARAWRAKAQLDFWLGDSEKAMEDADRAIEFARRVGDRQEETWMVRQYCMALWCGPTPAAEAARECERILAGAWNQTVAACALENLGGLRAMQGDLGEGRSLNERARAIYADLGLTYRVAVNLGFYTFFHHRLAGDPAAAERDVRRSIELFKSVGDEGARSTATAYLGHALYDLGRYDEAEQQILESEQLSGPDDWATQTNLWTARGRILARRGDLESARAAADRAIRIAEATDDLDTRGSVWADKAEVCEIAGDWKDAALCLEHAIALLDRKGDAVLAGRARARLASLAAGSPVDSAG